MQSFGQFLYSIRKRQNAAQLVKNVGISYVYLLDIEKGARSAPKEDILVALAENLLFEDGEKEIFFDLAAKERKSVPADICSYMQEHYEVIEFLRELKKKDVPIRYYEKMRNMIVEETIND